MKMNRIEIKRRRRFSVTQGYVPRRSLYYRPIHDDIHLHLDLLDKTHEDILKLLNYLYVPQQWIRRLCQCNQSHWLFKEIHCFHYVNAVRGDEIPPRWETCDVWLAARHWLLLSKYRYRREYRPICLCIQVSATNVLVNVRYCCRWHKFDVFEQFSNS